MINFFKNLKIKYRLFLLTGISVVGFALFGILSLHAINTVKVNGNLYKRIIQGKDLIADVVPPPAYIIESYLTLLQMLDETNPAKIESLIARVKALKGEYDTRHEVWVKELPENSAFDRELKEAVTKRSYDPAMEFQKLSDEQFIPLILKGERDKARELAGGILKEKYEMHRAAIDTVVEMSGKRNSYDEATARKILTARTFGLFVFCLLIISLISGVCFLVIRQITLPLFQVTRIAEKLSQGDLAAEKVALNSRDEIGILGEVLNRLVDSLHSIFSQVS